MSKSDNSLESISEPIRLLSLDCYRGMAMLLMVFSSWRWMPAIINTYPDSQILSWLHKQFQHLDWAGCTIWDMIQPSFMFMVGASLAFSYQKRSMAGETKKKLFLHAIKRAVILILLGVFLRSFAFKGTYWTFEDVLTQIGLTLSGKSYHWRASSSVIGPCLLSGRCLDQITTMHRWLPIARA